MKGAEAVLHALADQGIDVCFINPGTSEIYLVDAFDHEPRIRPVLCLFEGVVTGAADGYARITGRPASTILHLGPGLGNGYANLHNAKRAGMPVVNLIGEHATFHRHYETPLASDINAVARPVSGWLKTAQTPEEAVRFATEAVQASLGLPPVIATLLLPGDTTWLEAEVQAAAAPPIAVRGGIDEAAVRQIADALKTARHPAILLGNAGCVEAALTQAARLAAVGVRIMADSFVARVSRGEGRFMPERIPYFGHQALPALKDVDLLVTVGTQAPIAFYGYPKAPSEFLPEGARVMALAEPCHDAIETLTMLADAMGAPAAGAGVGYGPPAVNADKFNPHSIGAVIANHLPEGAIVSEDAPTSGLLVFQQTINARAHEWLMLTGGAIGQGMPVAIGAAIAAPERKIVCLSGDGAGAYTPQSLWTMEREKLDVVTVVFANRSYKILNMELDRAEAAESGPRAREMLDLTSPTLDWVAIARGFGVKATRCETVSGFEAAFAAAMTTPGPHLIEAVIS